MAEIIGAIISACIALVTLIISIKSFQEKGFLFNNAFLYASKQEREQMDKKPYYRQSAIAFAMLTIMFLLIAIDFILNTSWLWIVELGVACIAVVYAIVSAIIIEKKTRR